MSRMLRERVQQLECAQRSIQQELRQVKNELRREEENRYVQVVFPGTPRSYCYEVAEPFVGHVKVGDYLSVFSPMTGKNEIVKVTCMGRGSWEFGTKLARPISWTIETELPF